MSGYPPGLVTHHDGITLELRCPNEGCPLHGVPYECEAFWELGRTYLHRDDDGYCPECDGERETV